MALAAPLYFPNAPSSVWHWLFWGGITIMLIMIVDAGILLAPARILHIGPTLLMNFAVFILALAVIWQTNAGWNDIVLERSTNLVARAKFDETSRVAKIFEGKDETSLREEFDIPAILTKNINVQITRMTYIGSGNEHDFYYNNYSDNGNFIFWAKDGHYTTGPNGVRVEAGDKDVLFLVTTNKFQHALSEVVKFSNSAILDEPIKAALTDFVAVINQDTNIMMQVLDEKLHQDKRLFLQHNEYGTPYYGVISNDYVFKMVPLKPAADKVISAIAASWKAAE